MIEFENTKNDQKFFTLKEVEKSKELAVVENGLKLYEQKAGALVVKNEADYIKAGDFCKDIKTTNKRIEEKRKFFVDPYNQVVKKINTIFRGKINILASIETKIKNKMIIWYKAKEIRKEKEAEKVNKKLAKNPGAFIGGIAPAEKMEKTIAGDTAKFTARKITKWRIKDIKKIPLPYLMPDDKKITAAVRAGIEVPGIETYQDTGIAIS